MIVEHTAIVFFEQSYIFKVFMRLGFPLFAFMIAFGCTKTRNIKKYFIRLAIFAVITQLVLLAIHSFYYGYFSSSLSIFVTFSLAVLSIWICNAIYNAKIFNDKVGKILAIFLGSIIVLFIVIICDLFGAISSYAHPMYGGAGVLLVVLTYAGLKLKDKFMQKSFLIDRLGLIFATTIPLAIFNLYIAFIYNNPFQAWSMFAAIILWFFSYKKVTATKFEKYFFYLFYPLHFVALFLASLIFMPL